MCCKLKHPLYYVDINSMYPHAMNGELPSGEIVEIHMIGEDNTPYKIIS
jgi:hypothetical protein